MECKICKNNTQTIYDKQFEHIYYICEYCNFVFIDKAFCPTLEEEKQVYDRHQNSIEDKNYVDYLEAFIDEAVVPYIISGNGLDFGSGPEPVLALLLKKRGYNMDTFDICYKNDNKVWSKKYDFITSTEVIEHFHNPIDTLRKMIGMLADGGYLSIMTLFLPENISLFQDWWYRRDVTHVSFYNEKTFRVLAEILGLELVYCNGTRICVLKKID